MAVSLWQSCYPPPGSTQVLGNTPWTVWRAGCRWWGWLLSWGRRRRPTRCGRTDKCHASNQSTGWWNSTGAARCGRAPSRCQTLQPRLLEDQVREWGALDRFTVVAGRKLFFAFFFLLLCIFDGKSRNTMRLPAKRTSPYAGHVGLQTTDLQQNPVSGRFSQQVSILKELIYIPQ